MAQLRRRKLMARFPGLIQLLDAETPAGSESGHAV